MRLSMLFAAQSFAAAPEADRRTGAERRLAFVSFAIPIIVGLETFNRPGIEKIRSFVLAFTEIANQVIGSRAGCRNRVFVA